MPRTFRSRRQKRPVGNVIFIRGLSQLEKLEIERQALEASCGSVNEYMLRIVRWLLKYPDVMSGQRHAKLGLAPHQADVAQAIQRGVWPFKQRGRPPGSRKKKIRQDSDGPMIASPSPDLALDADDQAAH